MTALWFSQIIVPKISINIHFENQLYETQPSAFGSQILFLHNYHICHCFESRFQLNKTLIPTISGFHPHSSILREVLHFPRSSWISGSNPLPFHKVDLTPGCFQVKYLIWRYLLSDTAEWKYLIFIFICSLIPQFSVAVKHSIELQIYVSY